MSKKHFQALAAALYRAQPEQPTTTTSATDTRAILAMRGTWASAVDAVASVLADSNPRFDRARFREACETGKTRGMRQVS